MAPFPMHPSRRLVLQAATATAAGIALPGRTQTGADAIRIGRTSALSGPLSYPYIEMTNGIVAAFFEANAQGGINNRKLELLNLDDQGDPAKAGENTRKLIEDSNVLAFLGCGPTQSIMAMLPLLAQHKVPLIAPGTGLDALRAQFNPLIVYTRPTYGAEIVKIAQHLRTLGQNKCALVWSDNVFGKSALAAFEAEAAKNKNTEWKGFMFSDKMEDSSKLIDEIAAWEPTALVSAAVAFKGVLFFKALRSKVRVPAYTFSLVGSKSILDALGEQGRGFNVTQVVPNPDSLTIPVVKDYRAALKKSRAGTPNYSSLEGYIGARVLIEGLRRSRGDTDREQFLRSFLTMRPYDMGGFDVAYSPGDYTGSHFVELTYYNGDRFRR